MTYSDLWRPRRSSEAPPSGFALWAPLLVAGVTVVALAGLLLASPFILRRWHEHGYCRDEHNAIVANHERLRTQGQPDPYYDEHFVERQDFMSICLAKQENQRHGAFGLFHGPRGDD